MASEKNERLINLTIALLATRKYLTKAEIFSAVSGYDGNPEASDRMFERDKEELRALGIQLDMKSIDPLFEDEIGYRILPERYRFDLGELTTEEVSLLALASEAWKESALADIAHSTAIRLESLGINSDFSELPLIPAIANVPENFTEILEVTEAGKIIEFQYLDLEDQLQDRRVAPHGIYSTNSKWYLFATDLEKSEKRSFRLDRIEGSIKRSNKSADREEVELPTLHFPQIETILKIRRDSVPELLMQSDILNEEDDWIRCRISFASEQDAVTQILRHSPNVIVEQPIQIVSAVTKSLHQLVRLHG